MIQRTEDRNSIFPVRVTDCERRSNVRVRCLVTMTRDSLVVRWHDYTALRGHALLVKESGETTVEVRAPLAVWT